MSAVPTEPRAVRGLAQVPIGLLAPSPNNPRERLTDIDELAASMRSHGMIQPIVAQQIPGERQMRIVAGHRRYAAAVRLGWPTVPVIVRREMLPDEELTVMLIENGQRAGLDPIEEARAIKRLVTQGMRKTDIATQIGRSLSHVDMRLSLLRLTPQDQEEVRAGEFRVTEAVRKSRIDAGVTRQQPKDKAKAGARRWHFSHTHLLARNAKARCQRLAHQNGSRVSGGTACGECWEAVIRSDERQQLVDAAAARGRCGTCGHEDHPQPVNHQE